MPGVMHQDGTLKTPQSRADSWDIIQPRFQDTEFFVPLISPAIWFTYFTCFGSETSLEQCARDFYQYSSSTYCANVVCTDKMTEEGEKSIR